MSYKPQAQSNTSGERKPSGIAPNGVAYKYPVPEGGSQAARISLIVDIGTQERPDFEEKDKEYLLDLKKEVFKGNDFYVFGSRVNGTYLSDAEYEMYKDKYTNVKKSDWDIRSNFKVTIKEFKGYKIDFQIGNKGIKV